jgi:putative transposase
MRKKREFVDGAFYHVTSRTNDKKRVFENNLGRKIMLITLQEAKEKFNFRLTNFCIMPTHLHLLIKPEANANLSVIMKWIKEISAKRWNFIHGATGHLWGDRYYARAIKHNEEYGAITEYIDQNPVTAGLTTSPEEWKASGAYYKKNGLSLVDFSLYEKPKVFLCLPSIPFSVSRLIPPLQLEHVLYYISVYTAALGRFFNLILKIPDIGEAETKNEPKTYLHYYTQTHNYFISGYDGNNTMYGKVGSNVFPEENRYQRFYLSDLLKNPLLKLDIGLTPKEKKRERGYLTPVIGKK